MALSLPSCSIRMNHRVWGLLSGSWYTWVRAICAGGAALKMDSSISALGIKKAQTTAGFCGASHSSVARTRFTEPGPTSRITAALAGEGSCRSLALAGRSQSIIGATLASASGTCSQGPGPDALATPSCARACRPRRAVRSRTVTVGGVNAMVVGGRKRLRDEAL